MKILNSGDILETIEMLTAENLDVRTVTMGISLLDCIDPDGKKACEKIYKQNPPVWAGNLVPVVNKISADYGIPIVNKRISVTPIAMLLGAAPDADPVWFAKTLDAAAKRSASTLSAVTVLWCIRLFRRRCAFDRKHSPCTGRNRPGLLQPSTSVPPNPASIWTPLA